MSQTASSISRTRAGTTSIQLAALTALTTLLAGCASTTLDAEWRNTQLAPGYLQGARVLVSCEATEPVLRRICEDRLATELAAQGVVPVLARSAAASSGVVVAPDAQALGAARTHGAKAVFVVSLAAASRNVSPGFSIGLGGFGLGRHTGGSIGVAVPVGGGDVTTGYSANGHVTDAGSGRMMWSARASAPPSSDLNAQVAELAKTVVDAADKAGLF
ncbi:MAG TPA: hypothetical protein VFG60_04585 [Burkholderiaceae bacterium]|nr:hypothetical protein [Burkholderiaceae bacterium]